MPGESSIYWDSGDSHRSASGVSSEDARSSRSDSRCYVDPWDLENYAYLRGHGVIEVPVKNSREGNKPRPEEIFERKSRRKSECCLHPGKPEPGYIAPACLDEFSYKSTIESINRDYHQSLISEDETTHIGFLQTHPNSRYVHIDDTVMENYIPLPPPPHLDLNTYGYLKIDYANNWDSL